MREIDWGLIVQLKADICLLYHELAEYPCIMGDRIYGTLPYWEYLNIPELDREDRGFVRDGCLVMLLAMAWCEIDGAGQAIRPNTDQALAAVEGLGVEDESTRKLVQAVRLALDLADRDQGETDELIGLSAWAHRHYVQGYFRERVRLFDATAPERPLGERIRRADGEVD